MQPKPQEWTKSPGWLNSPRVGSPRPAWLNRYLTHPLLAFFIMIALAFSSSPILASAQTPSPFRAGRWSGIFFFTLTHSYSKPQEPVEVNDYTLEITGQGEIYFITGKNGNVQDVRIPLPGFNYSSTSQMVIKTDSKCKGYVAHGGGIGIGIAGKGGPPSLLLNQITSPAIKLDSGEPWGFATPVGDCGPDYPRDAFKTALKADIDGMVASSWVFTITAPANPDKWMAGTCSSTIWKTVDRTIECYWQAFRK